MSAQLEEILTTENVRKRLQDPDDIAKLDDENQRKLGVKIVNDLYSDNALIVDILKKGQEFNSLKIGIIKELGTSLNRINSIDNKDKKLLKLTEELLKDPSKELLPAKIGIVYRIELQNSKREDVAKLLLTVSKAKDSDPKLKESAIRRILNVAIPGDDYGIGSSFVGFPNKEVANKLLNATLFNPSANLEDRKTVLGLLVKRYQNLFSEGFLPYPQTNAAREEVEETINQARVELVKKEDSKRKDVLKNARLDKTGENEIVESFLKIEDFTQDVDTPYRKNTLALLVLFDSPESKDAIKTYALSFRGKSAQADYQAVYHYVNDSGTTQEEILGIIFYKDAKNEELSIDALAIRAPKYKGLEILPFHALSSLHQRFFQTQDKVSKETLNSILNKEGENGKIARENLLKSALLNIRNITEKLSTDLNTENVKAYLDYFREFAQHCINKHEINEREERAVYDEAKKLISIIDGLKGERALNADTF